MRTKRQLRLEQVMEKELEMLSKLDPIYDKDLYKKISYQYSENVVKYFKRYENYKSPYLNPSRMSTGILI